MVIYDLTKIVWETPGKTDDERTTQRIKWEETYSLLHPDELLEPMWVEKRLLFRTTPQDRIILGAYISGLTTTMQSGLIQIQTGPDFPEKTRKKLRAILKKRGQMGDVIIGESLDADKKVQFKLKKWNDVPLQTPMPFNKDDLRMADIQRLKNRLEREQDPLIKNLIEKEIGEFSL